MIISEVKWNTRERGLQDVKVKRVERIADDRVRDKMIEIAKAYIGGDGPEPIRFVDMGLWMSRKLVQRKTIREEGKRTRYEEAPATFHENVEGITLHTCDDRGETHTPDGEEIAPYIGVFFQEGSQVYLPIEMPKAKSKRKIAAEAKAAAEAAEAEAAAETHAG